MTVHHRALGMCARGAGPKVPLHQTVPFEALWSFAMVVVIAAVDFYLCGSCD